MGNGRGASRLRLRLLPTVLLTLFILVLPAATYAWGRSSSSFTIDEVVVTGAKRVPERRLLRLLQRDYLGRNLFTVTSEDVTETFSPLSYVAAAKVDRDFPTTLRVTVREYVPLVAAYAAGDWYAISDGGHVISPLGRKDDESGGKKGKAEEEGVSGAASPAASEGTSPSTDGNAESVLASLATDDEVEALLKEGPPGTNLRVPSLAVGGTPEPGCALDNPQAQLAVRVIAALPATQRRQLSYVDADDDIVTLHYRNGLEAVWGDGDRPVAKTAAIRLVLRRYKAKRVKCAFIDVSIPDRVLARPILR
jgi:cell division septal protein FtsQ